MQPAPASHCSPQPAVDSSDSAALRCKRSTRLAAHAAAQESPSSASPLGGGRKRRTGAAIAGQAAKRQRRVPAVLPMLCQVSQEAPWEEGRGRLHSLMSLLAQRLQQAQQAARHRTQGAQPGLLAALLAPPPTLGPRTCANFGQVGQPLGPLPAANASSAPSQPTEQLLALLHKICQLTRPTCTQGAQPPAAPPPCLLASHAHRSTQLPAWRLCSSRLPASEALGSSCGSGAGASLAVGAAASAAQPSLAPQW
jgi:hypothetical protein